MAIFTAILSVYLFSRENFDSQASDIWDNTSPSAKDRYQSNENCCGFDSPFDRPGPATCSSLTGCRDTLVRDLEKVNTIFSYSLLVLITLQLFIIVISSIVYHNVLSKKQLFIE